MSRRNSAFHAAIDALQQAYDALIAREWGDANAALGKSLLPIPSGAKAACTFETGWRRLMTAVEGVRTFHDFPDDYVWLSYGTNYGHSLANPMARPGNWLLFLHETRQQCERKIITSEYIEREIIAPMKDRDVEVRKAIEGLYSEAGMNPKKRKTKQSTLDMVDEIDRLRAAENLTIDETISKLKAKHGWEQEASSIRAIYYRSRGQSRVK